MGFSDSLQIELHKSLQNDMHNDLHKDFLLTPRGTFSNVKNVILQQQKANLVYHKQETHKWWPFYFQISIARTN